MDGHDPIGPDVDPSQDLVEGLFPEPIGDVGVPPEGPTTSTFTADARKYVEGSKCESR